jgi:hypothetical protein
MPTSVPSHRCAVKPLCRQNARYILGSLKGRSPRRAPVHVSLVYPFAAESELDERVTSALGELFVEQVPMPVEFLECYHCGGFVAVCPDPIDGLTELVSTTRRQWPDVVPYGEIYVDVEPHLTVAMSSSEEMAVTIEEVTAQLPISAELREAWLVVFEGQWTLRGDGSISAPATSSRLVVDQRVCHPGESASPSPAQSADCSAAALAPHTGYNVVTCCGLTSLFHRDRRARLSAPSSGKPLIDRSENSSTEELDVLDERQPRPELR